MNNLRTLEKTVKGRKPVELKEFRRWFTEFDAAAWDAQIEADASAGKLDVLAEKALSEYRSGKAREL